MDVLMMCKIPKGGSLRTGRVPNSAGPEGWRRMGSTAIAGHCVGIASRREVLKKGERSLRREGNKFIQNGG